MLDTDPTDNTTDSADTASSAAGTGGTTPPARPTRKRATRKTAAKTVTADSAAGGTAETSEAPPARPTRKRATRKAIAAAPETPALEGAPSADTPEQPETVAPAKKAARKSTRKAAKKIAVSGDGEASVQGTDAGSEADPAVSTAAPAKTARKRTTRKSAAAAIIDPTPAAESARESADSADSADAAPSADPAAAATGVLFLSPSEQAAPAKKVRKTAKKAGRKSAARAAEQAAADTLDEDVTGQQAAAAQSGRPGSGQPESAGADLTAAEDAEDETAEPEDVREAAIEQASGARRRRRRGRRGRGGARQDGDSADDGDSPSDETASTEGGGGDDTDDTGDDGNAAAAADETAEASGGGTSRRRRRRRAGSSDGDAGDDPPNTVTHVRESRERDKDRRDSDDDGVRGVRGSTRLEAKRQRRRDGRDTSRRRAPILTEAEFLARREAVDRVMAVRQTGERTQIAVLEDGILVEHYVTRAAATSYVGNVYLGRVQNVLPSMEAAFVDIGKGRNGVLYAGEVNWDAAGLEGKSRAIENALKSGDSVLVQVTKDPVGHKGARLTSQVSLPGRFLVLVPGGGMTGISRRLPDTERHRLKSILKKIVPEDAGVIVRTAAEGASEEDLTRDVERLAAQWTHIQESAAKSSSAPKLVHGEPDLAIRVVRDVFNEDFKSMVVQGDDAWGTVSEYVEGVAPDLAQRVSHHTGDSDLFHDLRVDEQLMKALDRKVWLPSGGSLVIDRTEAMTVVDVNTGKFVGSGGNLEQTVTRNNLEAAEEIVRQLRLRDVGGIVVIDFIDMVLESNRELVLRRLTECLGRDRTKHQVAEVTSLGLVQMTRKRVGEGLLEAFSETCEVCHGRGVVVHADPVDKQNGAPAIENDADAGRGKGKRRRGGAGGGGGKAKDATAPEELPPNASNEQRKAASTAMAAIHRATNGSTNGLAEGDEDGVDVEAEPIIAEAVQANQAIDKRASDADELLSDIGAQAHIEAERMADDTVLAVAQVEAGSAPAPTHPADSNGVAESGAGGSGGRRRRRAASRPAGPPGGS